MDACPFCGCIIGRLTLRERATRALLQAISRLADAKRERANR
ncbi:hypothetical protein VIMS_02435 [Mycobacterium marinum]|nr:hypothetical protein VIMS_02435 [Mycobacterium marinum]